MPTVDVHIRSEQPGDRARIARVHRAAFGGRYEADVVDWLHRSDALTLSLVATVADARSATGDVIGHIAFSPVTVDGADTSGVALAPLGVLPRWQRRGVGTALVNEGIRACRAMGCTFVVVLGDPQYYRRFGFERAVDFGLKNVFGALDAFMTLRLVDDAAGAPPRGTVGYAGAFRAAGG